MPHVMHVALEVALGWLLAVPAAHGVQVLAVVAPRASLQLPAGHGVQASAPAPL